MCGATIGGRGGPDLPLFLRFAVVGGIGFLADAALLQALVGLAGWGPLAARVPSFLGAVAVTWYLNRRFTFRVGRRRGGLRGEFARYLVVQTVGTGVNFALYALCVLGSELMAASPVLALAAASLGAMLVNYLGAKALVFVPAAAVGPRRP
jgi:putative flippase GtrA